VVTTDQDTAPVPPTEASPSPSTRPRSAPHAEAELLLDPPTVTRLAATSNHPAVRTVAQAWLRAYRAARRQGLDGNAARALGAVAWDRSCAVLRRRQTKVSGGC